MASRAIFAALLIIGAGAAACTRPAASRVVLPRDLAGCYALYDHRGAPASDSLYFAPEQVRLDTASRSRPSDTALRWSLLPLDAQGRPMHERGLFLWEPHSLSDSIHIVTTNGFSGTELIVAPASARRDTLRGRAVENWDMGPSSDDAGAVTAVRIPCVAGGAP